MGTQIISALTGERPDWPDEPERIQFLQRFSWQRRLLFLFIRSKGTAVEATRNAIAGRILTLGVVPSLARSSAILPEGRSFGVATTVKLQVFAPKLPPDGMLPDDPALRKAEWFEIPSRSESERRWYSR
jgi:hypothetical protein